MKILFISHYAFPHIGGVEKHIDEVKRCLAKNGHTIKVISENDIKYPNIKLFGLLYIWYWFFRNRKLIKNFDIVHIHDVFIWYLPFVFLYPHKKVYLTIHGGQDKWPIPILDRMMVKLGAKFTKGVITVGSFIPKYFHIKSDFVIFGGVNKKAGVVKRKSKLIIFLGRLEKSTGVLIFLSRIKKYHSYQIKFVGDGSLKKLCQKYGHVCGFCDPRPYLSKASICFAGGYLSALEALEYECKLWTGYMAPIKKEYWRTFPYKQGDRLPTWDDVAKIYENLYLHNS